MTDNLQLPFTLNQAQVDAAIAKELPALLEGIKIDYTHGRPPRGLTGTVVISEDSIRNAVVAHARKLVNPMFRHFSVDFTATRGEDGMTANIVASTTPIVPEAPAPETAAAPLVRAARAPAAVASPAPAAEPVEEVEEYVDQPVDAPFEGGEDAPVEADAEVEPEQEAEAPAEAKPAPTRTRLFGELKRPVNEPTE